MDSQEIYATLEMFDDPNLQGGLVFWLGSIATICLRDAGSATFFVRDERDNESLPEEKRKRYVYLAPFTQVHVDATALTDTTDYQIERYVRPILTTGRPVFVARKDGDLWEVELSRTR